MVFLLQMQSPTLPFVVKRLFPSDLPLSTSNRVCECFDCHFTFLIVIVKISSSEPTLSWRTVLPQIESSLDGTYDGGNATLEYLVKRDGSVALTHVIQIRNDQTNAHYEAFIDAQTGDLLSVTDFVTHASVSYV